MAGTIKSVEERTKELEAQGLAKIEERKQAQAEQNAQRAQAFNQQIDSGVAKQTGIYEQNIENQNRSLYEQLDANHINELIGRKKLEESMANMGLTDSGLNRGQQTALTVMHGNADAKARRATVDNVQQIMNAIDQLKITAEQQKTSNQQNLDDALSTWYQNAIQENYNNAVTNAATAYKADVEAQSAAEKLAQENYWKQQEHNLAMVKAGYVQQKDGSWVKDNTAERTTYAMTLIKNEVPEDEAWASAYYRYPTSDEKIKTYYAAYKDGAERGYTGDALEAYANAGGGSAGKVAANEVLYKAYDSELTKAKVDTRGLTKFYSGRFGDFITTEGEDIAALRKADQDAWNKSALKMSEKAQKELSKTALSDASKQYAEAKALGEQYSRIWELYRNVDDIEKETLSIKIYNALGTVLSGDMLQVAAEAAGLTVED